MSLDLFYTMVQKSQKWPKTQIKGGGSCLKSTASWSSIREMPLLAADKVRRCQTIHAKKPN